jgi:hypothetical protein
VSVYLWGLVFTGAKPAFSKHKHGFPVVKRLPGMVWARSIETGLKKIYTD